MTSLAEMIQKDCYQSTETEDFAPFIEKSQWCKLQR